MVWWLFEEGEDCKKKKTGDFYDELLYYSNDINKFAVTAISISC